MSTTKSIETIRNAAQELRLARTPSGRWRLAARPRLLDRPGELADLAAFLGANNANILRFFYNRSENPRLVRIEVDCASATECGALADQLQRIGRLPTDDREPEGDPSLPEVRTIMDQDGLLGIKATLEDRPGSLADLAEVLRNHDANVIHMAYDGDAAPGLVEITLAAASPEQISLLLAELNRSGLHFHVQWQGADGGPIDRVIGLSAIEQFLFRLRTILPPDKLDRLRALMESSDEMGRALLDFRRESGENPEAMAVSEVFSNILHLAAASIGKTGPRFSMRLTGPLPLSDEVALYMLACPTGANGYLLRTRDEDVLVDTGYGLYYPDARDWLAAHGFDPARIRRVYVTHPDADHAGWAAPLQEEFGARVFMHPDAEEVFRHGNRAHNTGTRLQALNVSFTRLITKLTDLRAPARITDFTPLVGAPAEFGGFPTMGGFQVGDLDFLVLESMGGHVAGQVFFLVPKQALLFCGDYLIDVASLSERDKQTLSIPKYLMTSTNSDSRVFSREMSLLRRMMLDLRRNMGADGANARIFSGHGGLYTVDEAGWTDQIEEQGA
jgi:glyoxylase-like metal-dependent hydrolase (beta-lactamase superfamily II)/ACT domain-containing protein